MKKLILSLLLLTPVMSVATPQNLDPFPDCWPCGKLMPAGGDQAAATAVEQPAEAR